MNKKVLKQLFWNALIFAVLMVGTFWLVLKDQDLGEIVEIAKSVNLWWLLGGFALMFCFLGFEARNIQTILNSFGEKVSFRRAYKHTMIGFFFAAVTPGATGGQPMEVYYMSRDGITAGNGTLALLIQVCGVQIATVAFGLLGMIANFGLMSGGTAVLATLGIILNSVALTIMLIAIFSPKLTRKLVHGFVKIFSGLGFKKLKEKLPSIDKNLDQYAKGSEYMKKHPREFRMTIARVLIQYCFYFAVPFMVYKAFGLSGMGFFQIFTLQALIFMATSALPLPGAIGASEATFLQLFSIVFGSELVSSATLLNRGVSFYGLVFLTLIVVFINNLLLSHRKK